MDPLHHFLVDLENFLDQNGYEISPSYPNDIELREKETGKLVGYWSTTVSYEAFQETK